MDVLIKRYRESEVNGLALLHQLAQSLELHLELKETGTSGKFKHFAFHYSAHIFQTFTSQALKLGFPLFGLSVSTKILFNQAQDFPQNIFPLCFQTTYHICVLPFVP